MTASYVTEGDVPEGGMIEGGVTEGGMIEGSMTMTTAPQDGPDKTCHRLTGGEQTLKACLPDSPAATALAQFGLPGRRCESWRWSDLRKALAASQPGMITAPVDNMPSDISADMQDTTMPVDMPDDMPSETPSDRRDGGLRDGVEAESDDADDGPLAHGPVWPDRAEKNSIYIQSIDGDTRFPANLPSGMTWRSDRQLNLRDDIPTPAALVPALARQMASAKTCLRLTENIDQPIVLRHRVTAPGAVAGHFDLRLDAGVRASLIELIEPQQAGFTNRFMQISLADGAALTHIVIQAESPAAVIVHQTDISLAAKAGYHRTSLGFGAQLARLETHIAHEAAGARAMLNAAYLISGESHIDMTSHIDHRVAGCETTQLVKGVANGAARGVFQGKFLVARDAQHTDARMTHNALMLSPKAEIRAKPELEIYADDVACAHGNTIGALDEDAVFYLMQRGLSRNAAKALLVKAFLGEVFDQVEDEDIRQHLIVLAAGAMTGPHAIMEKSRDAVERSDGV